MENDVVKYFENYGPVPVTKRRQLKRIMTQLSRYDVTDMVELCDLCEHSPDKLKKFRAIGEKSLELIREVCAVYKAEKEREERA